MKTRTITAEITKDDIILGTYATFNQDKADVIIALANQIAEDLGAPSANNILIDIANKVKHGSYQAYVWEAHKDQTKTCCKCGKVKSLYRFNSDSHNLDHMNKVCKDCLKLDARSKGNFERKKVSKEIRTITDAILNQINIDFDIVLYANFANANIYWSYPYKLRAIKNELIAKCQRIGFDYTLYSKKVGA